MSDLRLAEAYRCLRLDEDASLLDVERAYRSLKETYAAGGLATYSLLEPEQREAKLQAIEEAYRFLHHHLGLPRHKVEEVVPLQEKERGAETLAEGLLPGDELRTWRERRGLTIHEVGVRTKISPMTLENIEKQVFDRLPAPVYLRGFLVQYLSLLKVPQGERLVERYLSEYSDAQG